MDSEKEHCREHIKNMDPVRTYGKCCAYFLAKLYPIGMQHLCSTYREAFEMLVIPGSGGRTENKLRRQKEQHTQE